MAAKRELKTNTDTCALKLVAIACMLIDHLGAVVFPQYQWMRIVGRIAFPIFAYCLAVGCFYTHNIGRYALRVLLLGLVSQPLYATAFPYQTKLSFDWARNFYRLDLVFLHYMKPPVNILFTLALGILLIWTLRDRKYLLTGVLVLVTWYLQSYYDYGWKGIALIVMFYALLDRPAASFCWVAVFMCWWGLPHLRTLDGVTQLIRTGRTSIFVQLYALMALPLIYMPMHTRLRMPKGVFYLFYPAHLVLIYLLTM